MKKAAIHFLLFLIANQAKGQIFEERFRVYDITFKAKEITGQRQFNSSSAFYKTKILKPLLETKDDEFLNKLGTYYDEGTKEILDLFNLSLQNDEHPILDSIDFAFYKSKGFEKLIGSNLNLLHDNDFIEFKNKIDSAKTIASRKKILFDEKYLRFRRPLIYTRYSIIEKPFKVTQKKSSKTAINIKAQLDTILRQNGLRADANLRIYLSNVIDDIVDIDGTYFDARLDNSYVSTIKYYISNTPKSRLKDSDKFSFYLKKYIESKTAVANTGLVAILLKGTTNEMKNLSDSISFNLENRFSIQKEKTSNILLNLEHAISTNVDFSNTFDSTFIIRYFTLKIIDELNFLESEKEKATSPKTDAAAPPIIKNNKEI
jgi:hypothetical protein